jgi:hypothetical protein
MLVVVPPQDPAQEDAGLERPDAARGLRRRQEDASVRGPRRRVPLVQG